MGSERHEERTLSEKTSKAIGYRKVKTTERKHVWKVMRLGKERG
jgi:hypothetical protein